MTINEWLNNDELGIKIWNNKYRRNEESFNEWLDRVSGRNEKVKELILKKKFLFGGRILSNRGSTDEKNTYSNCYVIPAPEDNIESIYQACSNLARTYSYGGGCGIDISKLAPEGAKINNQAKSTSGAVSFMKTFNQVTEQIGQNGRRGALMISMDVSHPDIEKFITSKSDLDAINSANISVRVTDEFMKAVVDFDDWDLVFGRPETGEKIVKKVKARDIFDLIVKNNYDYAEPGMLFWDTIENYNMLATNPYFNFAGVNPCGEEPLPAGGSCLLGAMNLAEYVVNDENGRPAFDFENFVNDVETAVEALHTVLLEGMPRHPLKIQKNSVDNWAQIGLGIMGLSDMLIKMEMRYGSNAAVTLSNMIGSAMDVAGIMKSMKLAREHGKYPMCCPTSIITSPFMDYQLYKNYYFENMLEKYYGMTTDQLMDEIDEYGLRHSQLFTIAPTGSISTMLGVSGGIEPIFANKYTRKTQSLDGKDTYYEVYTPIVQEYMNKCNIEKEEDLPDFFATARKIHWRDRIRMQAAWQKHIDASISSTINLPEDSTIDDIRDIYTTAWASGLKGVTVFRENCKRAGVLVEKNDTTDKTEDVCDKPDENATNKYDSIMPIKPRNEIREINGTTYRRKSACGTLYVTLNSKDGNIVESFVNTSKSGICQAHSAALNQLVSLCLRSGVKVDEIVDKLKGVSCSACVKAKSNGKEIDGISCPDVIGRVIEECYNSSRSEKREANTEVAESMPEPNVETVREGVPVTDICPECGAVMDHEGSCMVCHNCDFRLCGD